MRKNFTERSPLPIWLWLFLLFLAATLALAFWAALGNRWGAITGLVELLLLFYTSQRSTLEIEVTPEEFRVGSAHIERKFLGEIQALSPEEMRKWRGPLSDPACYMALRFWIPGGVKIAINDPKDKTPYWLISSKKAQPLVAALLERD